MHPVDLKPDVGSSSRSSMKTDLQSYSERSLEYCDNNLPGSYEEYQP